MQASAVMYRGYKSYLEDYKAKDDDRSEKYLLSKHKDMNKWIDNIVKNAGDDSGSS